MEKSAGKILRMRKFMICPSQPFINITTLKMRWRGHSLGKEDKCVQDFVRET
jgi:hypothetical protein